MYIKQNRENTVAQAMCKQYDITYDQLYSQKM